MRFRLDFSHGTCDQSTLRHSIWVYSGGQYSGCTTCSQPRRMRPCSFPETWVIGTMSPNLSPTSVSKHERLASCLPSAVVNRTRVAESTGRVWRIGVSCRGSRSSRSQEKREAAVRMSKIPTSDQSTRKFLTGRPMGVSSLKRAQCIAVHSGTANPINCSPRSRRYQRYHPGNLARPLTTLLRSLSTSIQVSMASLGFISRPGRAIACSSTLAWRRYAWPCHPSDGGALLADAARHFRGVSRRLTIAEVDPCGPIR